MASPTQWTWIWVNYRSWWQTGRPGVLWFMGSQRVRHDWVKWTKSYGFSSSHVRMGELNHKEGWEPKKWSFQIVMLEKTLESPLDTKEIKSVTPKGNQPWILIGRTDAEPEALILWPPDAESTHWKRPWWWERLKAVGEGGDRGWDGWMESLTQWTWVWATSGR